MEIWPQGAWFGLTRRRLCSLLKLARIAVVICLAGFLLARAMVARKAHHLEEAIAEVRSLTLGSSTFSDAKAIADRYHGQPQPSDTPCISADCSFMIYEDTFPSLSLARRSQRLAEILWNLEDIAWLNRVGLRPWRGWARITVRNGRVVSSAAQVFVEGPGHEWVDSGWWLLPEMPDLACEHVLMGGVSSCGTYAVMKHHLHMGNETGQGMIAYITPASSQAERMEAFGLNLSCLTRIAAPCATLHDLNPAAAAYLKSRGVPGAQ